MKYVARADVDNDECYVIATRSTQRELNKTILAPRYLKPGGGALAGNIVRGNKRMQNRRATNREGTNPMASCQSSLFRHTIWTLTERGIQKVP